MAAAWLSGLYKGSDPTRRRVRLLLPFMARSPSSAPPPSSSATSPHHHHSTPPVCLAVTQSAMCVLRTLHNALLSLHSGSKRTIQHREKTKICSLLIFFFLLLVLFHHRIVVFRLCTVRWIVICFSIAIHVENQTEHMGGGIFRGPLKTKQVKPDGRDAQKNRYPSPVYLGCAFI